MKTTKSKNKQKAVTKNLSPKGKDALYDYCTKVGIKDGREDLIYNIFNKVLDYGDIDFITKSSEWGLKTYYTLKNHNYQLVTIGDTDKGRFFIYMLTLAHIVGGFGNRAFGDHNSVEATDEELEINLEDFNLEFKDIECYLEENINKKRLTKIKKYNYVTTQDIWATICDYKKSIHNCIIGIYKDGKEKEPTYKLYMSLVNLFYTENISFSFEKQQEAYSFVDNGFSI